MNEKEEIAPVISGDGKWFIRRNKELWHFCTRDLSRLVLGVGHDEDGCLCGAEIPEEVLFLFNMVREGRKSV